MCRRLPLQRCLLAALALSLIGATAQAQSWCEQPPRAGFEGLERVAVSDAWFQVHRVEPGVFAIGEPFNFQETISWLIVGSREALLFDTGMGLGRIEGVVRELTTRPVTVLNSHSHFDHIGGNAEFASILAMDTEYSRTRARGSTHAQVASEVTTAALCRTHLPPAFDTATYRIRPFVPTGYVRDGTRIDLGDRRLEVLHVPGHAPDAIALVDRANALLWTGDTFYEGPLWLYSAGTDLEAYGRSAARLAALAPSLRRVLPAHNLPVADPRRLVPWRDAFLRVRAGAVTPVRIEDGTATFDVDGFSFLLPAPPPPPAPPLPLVDSARAGVAAAGTVEQVHRHVSSPRSSHASCLPPHPSRAAGTGARRAAICPADRLVALGPGRPALPRRHFPVGVRGRPGALA